MGNSKNGYGSASVLVLPSMNNSILPTGALVIVKRPLLSVSADRFVPLILAVTLTRGSLALSSTIPLTVVLVGLRGVRPEATKVAGAPESPSKVAETILLL